MARPNKHITLERIGDVFCIRLPHWRLDENDIIEMTDEISSLIADDDCRKMAFNLGPGQVECLYSVFLAKLVMIKRLLSEKEGSLKICGASPETIGVFAACHLKEYFDFVPDQKTAIEQFAR